MFQFVVNIRFADVFFLLLQSESLVFLHGANSLTMSIIVSLCNATFYPQCKTILQCPDQIKISEYHLTIAGQTTDRKLKVLVTRADQQNILMTFYDHGVRSHGPSPKF
jgi:hypothetical protein